MNFDKGILPAASQHVKNDLKITDLCFGLLGSAVIFG